MRRASLSDWASFEDCPPCENICPDVAMPGEVFNHAAKSAQPERPSDQIGSYVTLDSRILPEWVEHVREVCMISEKGDLLRGSAMFEYAH